MKDNIQIEIVSPPEPPIIDEWRIWIPDSRLEARERRPSPIVRDAEKPTYFIAFGYHSMSIIRCYPLRYSLSNVRRQGFRLE